MILQMGFSENITLTLKLRNQPTNLYDTSKTVHRALLYENSELLRVRMIEIQELMCLSQAIEFISHMET